MRGKQDQEHIRKGPWKAEEDEVLVNHVKKYGARDWSSIRSKGLLQRTGKSCRLRWVNKLQPNLKNGCKFSVEEERVVIELQAQVGNKWARIASYLPGRTDNDVKNFWSSRQKRLARIRQKSELSSKSQKNSTPKVPNFHDGSTSTLEAPKFSFLLERDPSSMPQQSCSLSCNENSMLPSSATNHVEQEFTTFESYNSSTEQIAFPQVSEIQTDDLTFSVGNQDLLARFDEPNFIDVFGPLDASSGYGIGLEIPIGLPLFEPSGSSSIGTSLDALKKSKNSDSFFDDFPVDIFDDMEPPASPSNH